MKMIRAFFDCEFSDLQEDAWLLSIAMVAESGDELYIEVTDARHDAVSPFVQSTVLPLLGRHHPLRIQQSTIPLAISRWVNQLRKGEESQSIEFISDSEWDWQFLDPLLDLDILHGEDSAGSISWSNASDRFGAFDLNLEVENIFARSGHAHERHHALVDARVLREAVQQMESKIANKKTRTTSPSMPTTNS
jgi:hypothetical protein